MSSKTRWCFLSFPPLPPLILASLYRLHRCLHPSSSTSSSLSPSLPSYSSKSSSCSPWSSGPCAPAGSDSTLRSRSLTPSGTLSPAGPGPWALSPLVRGSHPRRAAPLIEPCHLSKAAEGLWLMHQVLQVLPFLSWRLWEASRTFSRPGPPREGPPDEPAVH